MAKNTVDRADIIRKIHEAQDIVNEAIPDAPLMEEFRQIAFDQVLGFLMEYEIWPHGAWLPSSWE